MVKYALFSFLITWVTVQVVSSQELPTANTVLERAIAFHDPNDNWNYFDTSFKVIMESPNAPKRTSTIKADFVNQEFVLDVEQDGNSYTYDMSKGNCSITLNGSKEFSEAEADKLRLSCERGTTMKNYYTYLYGLPMKLKDPGTLLDEKVEVKTFKDKEYLVLKVRYDEKVGSDTWYFYFDPKTYAMEVYQFYHDESKNDGEYILLEGLEEINGIQMPKTRAWYLNKDDKYLGTDILTKG
ncbi:DUF6503 family protein [Flagellimonas olearia]|uniref:Uncharacterized protein n=1 Tax=Flagellimonas olearia TaxID=552546 RepID=A0A444VJ00_9FLAO|nr:DUF6503 family protein [Allomuricauda olearia]RYC50733.1 hypothetical protein DN53_16565 [Allomuricauda olearia]